MENNEAEQIQQLIKATENLTIRETLLSLIQGHPGSVVFSTSFSYEDQVITHEILSHQLPVSIFTLDTGRLFAETYSVWSRTNEFYQTSIKGYYPDAESLEEFVWQKGPNSFYENVENRKQCCFIRKVEPLKRALQGNRIWITGLRAEHSHARQDLQLFEWDNVNHIIKYNPLLNWSTEQTIRYVHQHKIPYNPLHDKGFVSIGCAPCTRAIKEGEDFRAGRWWWEDAGKKECGLHEKQA
ncbi:MAG: phosphoadenylyl-sulfate reductase [Sphingobacteriia bacterium]|nr:phosphoadenylyl-sulfate reductase [Sphingobacteriia bacterium]